MITFHQQKKHKQEQQVKLTHKNNPQNLYSLVDSKK